MQNKFVKISFLIKNLLSKIGFKNKKSKTTFFVLFLFLLILFFHFSFYSKNKEEETKTQNIFIAGKNIKSELALTPEERTQGLSGRKGLAEDEGMLFVFDAPDYYAFWMKEMNFPIDIIWLDEDKKVVFIKENALPESYPELFIPSTRSKYVLEVLSFFVRDNGLKLGDVASF